MKKIFIALGFMVAATAAHADNYDNVIKLTATVTAYHITCEKIEKQYKEQLYGFATFIVFGDYDKIKADKDLFAEVKKQLKEYDQLQQDYCNTVKEVLIKWNT